MKKFVLSSVHCIVVAVIALASFSWAWFTEVVSGPSTQIKAATYEIEAEVSGNGTVLSGDRNSIFEVENGKVYDITLRSVGTADKGFCIVSAGDVVYHTAQVTPGDSSDQEFNFRIVFEGSGTRKIQFLPYWGKYRDEHSAGTEIKDGVSIGDVPGKTRTVTPGDAFTPKVSDDK